MNGSKRSGEPPLAPPDQEPPDLKLPEPMRRKVGYAVVGLGVLAVEEVLPAFRQCRLCEPVALPSLAAVRSPDVGRPGQCSMDRHGMTDIRTFRVRLPAPLDPYRGKQTLQVCDVTGLANQGAGWFDIDRLAEFFPSKFSQRNPLNRPGPLDGAETDTCCTRPQEAPESVLLDRNGQEFVFQQPAKPVEFRDVLSAAICECFQGDGADGDTHWRLSTIRDWWRNRGDMVAEVDTIDERYCKPESIDRWRRTLHRGAKGYLRVYAFFVENGRAPTERDLLPDLS